jgi:hypothetical protein
VAQRPQATPVSIALVEEMFLLDTTLSTLNKVKLLSTREEIPQLWNRGHLAKRNFTTK